MGVATIKPNPIYFRQKYPRYPCVRGQVGSTAGLEATEKKNLNIQDSKFDSSFVQSAA
jgi:hypothetical protein